MKSKKQTVVESFQGQLHLLRVELGLEQLSHKHLLACEKRGRHVQQQHVREHMRSFLAGRGAA